MRTSASLGDGVVSIALEPEEEDQLHIKDSKIGLGSRKAEIFLEGLNTKEIHPDLIALSTILICHPFVSSRLKLPCKVSDYFLETCRSVITRYSLEGETEDSIQPIKPPNRGRPGLAFSGGADSTAALSVMPSSTVPIFMNRPMKKGSQYNSDAALNSCNFLNEVGFDMIIVDSDLEYVRDPVGFPTDIAHSIPAILLSQHLGLDSIAFGTVLESAYGIGHERFIDYPKSAHYRFFGTMLSAIGLQMSLPVAGISEVGTAIINKNSDLGIIAQSCIRGGVGLPCLNCWKCFRKELLGMAISLPSSGLTIAGIMLSSEVQKKLSEFPINHENVITFSIQNIDMDEHRYLRVLRNRLNTGQDLEFLRNWNASSIEVVPPRYADSIRKRILSYIEPMSSTHEEQMMSWDMMPFLESKRAKEKHFELTSFWQDFYGEES